MTAIDKCKLAIIGLGYVGLPLAVEFGKVYPTIGFDIKRKRIDELNNGYDSTNEVSQEELNEKTKLTFSFDDKDIKNCNIFIITVPTPIDSSKKPDLTPLSLATRLVAKCLKKDDIVIYESTVYPGVTEEFCVPILEKNSTLKFNTDFYCGYSPERINPGDKNHRLTNIKKVTSGSTHKTANFVDNLYKSIISAGTHKAKSIKVAEAAKVIENTQRDVNIALVNELAIIFNILDIDTEEVLEAAGTKWNFLHFKPGLVGGHCIGIDPYYLTYKSIEAGYRPEMILAGRNINDGMASHVVCQVKKLMKNKGIRVSGAKILLMGLTFKENCPDIRNTKVVDIFNEFLKLNCKVDIFDPLVNPDEAKETYRLSLIQKPIKYYYDAILIAVAHDKFKEFSINEIRSLGKKRHILYDIKHLLTTEETDGRL